MCNPSSPPCFVHFRAFLPTSPTALRPTLKRPRATARATPPPPHARLHPSSAPTPARPPSTAPVWPVAIAVAVAALSVLAPMPALAKNLLTENTLFRRYLIVDSAAILRYALPLPSERIGDPAPAPIRLIQASLEKLGVHLRARGVAGLISGRRDLTDLSQLLSQRQLDILLDVPAARRKEAAASLTQLERGVADMLAQLGDSGPVVGEDFLPPEVVRFEQKMRDTFTPRNSLQNLSSYDAALVQSLRADALERVSDIETLSINDLGLPFRIPRRYNTLPRLNGRATVSITVEKQSGDWVDANRVAAGRSHTFTAVLDGYSAPLTAGNFLDLARRRYYDGTPVLASERGFYAQLGERLDDDVAGFHDPQTRTRRTVPLEIMTQGERAPAYGASLDDLGIADLQPTLPVSAFGAMAMVHSIEDVNDASAQFYVFVLDPTSYQARAVGGTALSGSVATFGYIVDGEEFLWQLGEGDRITTMRVVEGEEKFQPAGN